MSPLQRVQSIRLAQGQLSAGPSPRQYPAYLQYTLALCLVGACASSHSSHGRPPESRGPRSAMGEGPTHSAPGIAPQSRARATTPTQTAPRAPVTPAAQTENAEPYRLVVGEANEVDLHRSAPGTHSAAHHRLQPSTTAAAVHFTIVDKATGPISGQVVAAGSDDGQIFYTPETDAEGRASVLLPVDQRYELMFLTLGQRDIAARITVEDEPNQNINLTLRYGRRDSKSASRPLPHAGPDHLVLEGVEFETGKAVLRAESFPRFNSVLEYLIHRPSARIEIAGHTDNQGNARNNQRLSERRAEACRTYLVAQGIEPERIMTVGYGASRPIAPNDTPAGRQKNRRIEAVALAGTP